MTDKSIATARTKPPHVEKQKNLQADKLLCKCAGCTVLMISPITQIGPRAYLCCTNSCVIHEMENLLLIEAHNADCALLKLSGQSRCAQER